MIKTWDKLKHQIERGKKGYNVGLPMGFDRLSSFITNIQQGRYDTIGGNSGTGKTALVDNAYLFNPYDFLQKNDSPYKLEVLYYSLEIDPEVKLAKFLARKIWEDHGILTNINEIYSRGKFSIRPEVAKLIDVYQEYFDKLQSEVLFFRSSLTPNFLYKDVMGYAEKRGTFVRNKDRIIVEYIPNNPFLITLIIIDHMSLIGKNGEDKSKKESMDRASKTLVFFRNMCKFSPVVVSQFNRSNEQMDRKENNALEPQTSDWKDTGNIIEDCNTAIGLFNPFKFGVESHRGYPVINLKGRYKSLHVLKNRDGLDNLSIGMHFLGEVGLFKELPKSKDLQNNPQLLKKILDYGKVEGS